MIAVVTILLAFPVGYRMRSWFMANVTYAIAYLWAFVYQSMYLTLDSFSGTSDNPAFEPTEFPWAYGVVTLSIFCAGFATVALGHRVGTRRRERNDLPVTV